MKEPVNSLNIIQINDIKKMLKNEVPSSVKLDFNSDYSIFCDWFDYYKEKADSIPTNAHSAICKLVNSWKNRVTELNLKPSQKAYYKEQAAFFSGGLMAITEIYGQEVVPAGILICISVGRDILKEWKY